MQGWKQWVGTCQRNVCPIEVDGNVDHGPGLVIVTGHCPEWLVGCSTAEWFSPRKILKPVLVTQVSVCAGRTDLDNAEKAQQIGNLMMVTMK